MKHTSVYLDDEVHMALRMEALKAGITMTELLRQLVDEHLKRKGHRMRIRGEPPRPGRKKKARPKTR